MEPLGMRKKPDGAEQKRREKELVALYDSLFEKEEFVRFLKGLAERCGMFRQSTGPRGDWHEGYSAALRDVVNHAMRHSTSGPLLITSIFLEQSENQNKREVKE